MFWATYGFPKPDPHPRGYAAPVGIQEDGEETHSTLPKKSKIRGLAKGSSWGIHVDQTRITTP